MVESSWSHAQWKSLSMLINIIFWNYNIFTMKGRFVVSGGKRWGFERNNGKEVENAKNRKMGSLWYWSHLEPCLWLRTHTVKLYNANMTQTTEWVSWILFATVSLVTHYNLVLQTGGKCKNEQGISQLFLPTVMNL